MPMVPRSFDFIPPLCFDGDIRMQRIVSSSDLRKATQPGIAARLIGRIIIIASP